jgi:putative hydrolase of the HAD superfamily
MRERPPLEAVLFDAGGTLVRLDFEWMSDLLASLGVNADPIRIRRAEVDGRRRYDASARRPHATTEASPPLGSAGDTHAYYRGTLEASGVPEGRVDEVIGRFEARHADGGLWTRPVEGARSALDRVQALGLRIAVVSNSDGRAEQHLIDCGVRDGLEFVVDSHRVGAEKPHPRIFQIALERLAVPPGRALYVGDIVAVDVRGARAAGMHVVLIDPYRSYAPRGVDAIPHIGALPEWIVEHFAPQDTGRAPRAANALAIREGGPS